MNFEDKLKGIIKKQDWLMEILRVARDLKIPNWYIGGGTIRNTIWDILSFGKMIHYPIDIDIPFFSINNTSREYEEQFEALGKSFLPQYKWEIRNQARSLHGMAPASSTEEGISCWIETATTVAIRLENDNSFTVFSGENGFEDLFSMIVRPIKNLPEDRKSRFKERYTEKRWLEQWPKLKIVERLA